MPDDTETIEGDLQQIQAIYEEIKQDVDNKQGTAEQETAIRELLNQTRDILNMLAGYSKKKLKLKPEDTLFVMEVISDLSELAKKATIEKDATSKIQQELVTALQQATGSHNQAERKLCTIRPFDNSGQDYYSFAMFKAQVENAAWTNNWTDRTSIGMSKASLIGEAARLALNIKPQAYSTLGGFLEALGSVFLPPNETAKAEAAYMNCCQQPTQTIRTYWSEVRFHFSRAYPERASSSETDRSLISHFINHLKDAIPMEAAILANCRTYEEALRAAEAKEGAQQRVQFNLMRRDPAQQQKFQDTMSRYNQQLQPQQQQTTIFGQNFQQNPQLQTPNFGQVTSPNTSNLVQQPVIRPGEPGNGQVNTNWGQPAPIETPQAMEVGALAAMGYQYYPQYRRENYPYQQYRHPFGNGYQGYRAPMMSYRGHQGYGQPWGQRGYYRPNGGRGAFNRDGQTLGQPWTPRDPSARGRGRGSGAGQRPFRRNGNGAQIAAIGEGLADLQQQIYNLHMDDPEVVPGEDYYEAGPDQAEGLQDVGIQQ